MNCQKSSDPYLRHASDLKPPLGMSASDFARMTPGPSLARTFEMTRDEEQKDYPKSPKLILCRGAAIGLDESGTCTHMAPGLKFLGFLESQNELRAGLRTRGSVLLTIPGATDKDRGKSICCDGPNSFSMGKKRGAAEIGKVRFVQNGKAAIAFRRYNDDRPLNLDVR